jgi:hypothetical protein
VVNALIEIVWDLSFVHMTPCGSDDSLGKLKSLIGMRWAAGRFGGFCWGLVMQGSIIREIVKNSICTCVGVGGWGGDEVGYVHVCV